MGDTGEGNAGQLAVANAIAIKCAADGCDFVILLGDNIYDSGAESTTDPQWADKFETPYAAIDLPFYPVLGNHDYGGALIPGQDMGGLGNEFDKGPIEVQYSQVSSKWKMPATHYTLKFGPVGLIMLDTNSILWDNVENGDQSLWYPTALAELSDATWIIAAGHHPLRSNGAHGNAGEYESVEIGDTNIPIPVSIMNGASVESFFASTICGTVDIALAGHDHNRQRLNEPSACNGAELIVSGAGAKTKGIDNPTRNVARFQDATTPGFLYVSVDGPSLRGEFIDMNGSVDFTHTLTK